jgi:hypothetical protein
MKITAKRKPLLVAGFPGTGKTSYCYRDADYMPQGFAVDSDSSKFDKANFPANYIEHIKERISENYSRIFISSHKEVRDALVANKLQFTLVYPQKGLKEEYLTRYKERGDSQAFIALIDKNWFNWLSELSHQIGCTHIELKSGQFIGNVL